MTKAARCGQVDRWLKSLSAERPVLIAGPTASGKSALALEIAAQQGGVIVNADAMQVFADWRILTSRPSGEDEDLVPHRLYGHVVGDSAYSVGQWLREAGPILAGAMRPIFVGGTGLYFAALTEGLAAIPETPSEIRWRAAKRIAAQGVAALLAEIDPATAARIDRQNPMRIRRAWEVLTATGRGLAAWQDDTPPPLLPPDRAETIVLKADRDWLVARIDRRIDAMRDAGVMDEAKRNAPAWHPALPSARAIGAAELIAVARGQKSLDQAFGEIRIATRQYAKRQRTWFRSRMAAWSPVLLP